MGGCCIGDCCVMDNFVGDFFRDLTTPACSYHPGSIKTTDHAEKIANELADMKEKYSKSSKKNEEKIINHISSSMDDLLKLLNSINRKQYGGKVLNINIESLREKNEDLKKQVVGSIEKRMNDRLVLTDKELSAILEERDDKKRGKNFKNFCVKIQKNAIADLKNNIQKTVKEQEKMIEKEINDR